MRTIVIIWIVFTGIISNANSATQDISGSKTTVKRQSDKPAPAPQPGKVLHDTLNTAYKKEFTFLDAQKRELQKRLVDFRQERNRSKAKAERKIASLESEALALSTRLKGLETLVTESERVNETLEEGNEFLEMTITQADVTLDGYGLSLVSDPRYNDEDDLDKLTLLFEKAEQLLERSRQLRETTGKFFLSDGTETEGKIVELGQIAAFGISEAGSGLLAPAGDNRFKLWKQPAGDVAQAIGQGEQPKVLKMFLFETKEKAIEEEQQKTVLGTINDGGIIAWIIVALGMLALLLIVFRITFLKSNSRGAQSLTETIAGLIHQKNPEEALNVCDREKGSTARVLAATVRNLNRDRDHLEDIISEAVLHESSSLNRFGTFILVIASVAPLLGLLGTVTGMIATFDVITQFGTGDPKLLSGGISIALITTEVGLAIAIPTLLVGTLLSGWAERIKDDIEKSALHISNIASV